ncbi:hypothetical protein ACLB1Q_08900 [Escherichia coli]
MNGGPRKISLIFVPSTIVNMVASDLTIMYAGRPSISIATACFRRARFPAMLRVLSRMAMLT